jgi:hypothetical protein
MLAVGVLSLLVAIPGAIVATRELLVRRAGARGMHRCGREQVVRSDIRAARDPRPPGSGHLSACKRWDDRASCGHVCVATIQIDDRVYHLMPGRGRGTAPYLGHRSSAR